jgi:hypothetical protein
MGNGGAHETTSTIFDYSHNITALASRASGYYQPEGRSKSMVFASVMLSSFHMARIRLQNGGERK